MPLPRGVFVPKFRRGQLYVQLRQPLGEVLGRLTVRKQKRRIGSRKHSLMSDHAYMMTEGSPGEEERLRDPVCKSVIPQAIPRLLMEAGAGRKSGQPDARAQTE